MALRLAAVPGCDVGRLLPSKRLREDKAQPRMADRSVASDV